MNPNTVLEALQGLRETWASVATVGDFQLRLVAVCALLEERLLQACDKAFADGQFLKAGKLLSFAGRCDDVRQEADGSATLCMQLAQRAIQFHLTAADAELDKEKGMHPKTVLDSLGYLPELFPKMEGEIFSNEIDRADSTASGAFGAAELKGRLEVIRSTLAERMSKALDSYVAADESRKVDAIIKFAYEYDSIFSDLGMDAGSLAEDLQNRAENGNATAEAKTEAAAKPERPIDNGEAGAALKAARAKLEDMKKSDLQKLARSMAISEEDRDAALDADDPKSALVELVFAKQKEAIEAEEAKRAEALQAEKDKRDQLAAMKKSDLQKLARSLGVSEEDRDAALDADDPKVALIDLILPLQGLDTKADDDEVEAGVW
jgi:hypothetical protein